jgi:hypothetical protein
VSSVFDLDAVEPDAKKASGFTFIAEGREWHCRPKSEMHWDTIRSWLLAQESVGDAKATSIKFANHIVMHADEFFRAVIVPEEIDDFFAAKADPAGSFTSAKVMALVVEINSNLLGTSEAANPTKRPAASRAGSRTTKPTSKAASRSRATKAS